MIAFFGSAFLAMLATVAATPIPPPAAKALWTIASDDCVSVHTDGEPWDECGFQAFAMNADGTRVLTVSARGTIQLWDSAGREVRRIDWPDQPSGASGSPGGRAIVSGNIGVAITHYNQIAVIDLASGKILSQRVAQDVMTIDELRFVSPHRLLARGKDEMWKLGIREIALPTGEVREMPNTNGWTTLESPGRKVWLTGGRRRSKSMHALPPEQGPQSFGPARRSKNISVSSAISRAGTRMSSICGKAGAAASTRAETLPSTTSWISSLPPGDRSP